MLVRNNHPEEDM